MDRMRKVMMLTFGRTGWRRHELLAIFRRPEQPLNSTQLEASFELQDGQTLPARGWLESWDKDKLLLFAKSQAGRSLRSSPRPQAVLKRLDPKKAVPSCNIWGKPLAAKPARTKELKWWKQVENRILPPLPRSEWDLLKQLATGTADSRWDVPPRRAPVATTQLASTSTSTLSGGSSETWAWEKYLTGPMRVIERPNSRRFKLPLQSRTPQHAIPLDGPAIGYHNYTPRFWRRLYNDMWQLSSVIETKTSSGDKWDIASISWGGTGLKPLPPSTASLEFFKGLDSNGNQLVRPEGEARRAM
ncbi:hypothetical protein SEPCBS119000_004436 [Sporothrix epigloea]|uniref:Mitochondrial zinc maintenance protein 1, mitochondrial n=1 Tax=Sporothrix epigloea TaxID=1892477 RepID=A0ABP0DS44_9PEZI